MDIKHTPLSIEVDRIVASGIKPIKHAYIGELHTKVDNLSISKIVTIDIIRDYVNKIGDSMSIEFIMPLGDYVKKLYPYRTNLELTISKQLLSEVGSDKRSNTNVESARYKAVFLTKDNKNLSGGEYDLMDIDSLNMVDIVTVHLQLLNRALEPLRIKTTGGVFKSITPYNLMHALIVGEANQIRIDGKPAIGCIDIVKPSNSDSISHVIIPQTVKVLSLPTYLQEKVCGVYTGGIGTYLQVYKKLNTLFIYPLFNTKRFTENVPKLILFSIPSGKYGEMERTYRKDGNIVYVLGTGNKSYSDDGEADYMDQGVGFRMTDANAFMRKPVVMDKDGPVGARGRLNTEVAIKNRADNLNYAPSTGVSSNSFAQYSRVMQRDGGRFDFVWENADYTEIYPGMPCKLVYMADNTTVELNGVILFNHILIQTAGQGINAKAHTATCNITMFVSKKQHP